MYYLIAVAIILIYLFIGFFVSALIDPDELPGIAILLWPFVTILYALFGIYRFPIWLARKIREHLNVKGD